MSRKHNVKHQRSKSRYPKRLRDRGETSSSVRMRTITHSATATMLGITPAAYAALCAENSERLNPGRKHGKPKRA